MSSRSGVARTKSGGNWIAGAIKHPGAFTAEAKEAGEGVQEYAREKKHAKGKTGARARLALRLSAMRH